MHSTKSVSSRALTLNKKDWIGSYSSSSHTFAKFANSPSSRSCAVYVAVNFQALAIGLHFAQRTGEIEKITHKRDGRLAIQSIGTNKRRKTIMAKLIVVGFKKDIYRASEVLNQLQSMNDDWVVDLHDAVAVYRDYNGKLRIDQSYQMTTGEGAAFGGLMGSLIGLTLATIPFTGGASAVAAGTLAAGAAAGGALGAGAGAIDASWWKDEFGIPENFVKQVGGMIQPGDSAIYALLRTANSDVVADQFRGCGGTILSTTLSRDQQAKVENVLNSRAA